MIKQTKYGWMDFSDLPKTTNGKIDWMHSGGHIILFKYGEIISQCMINKVVDNRHLDISIDNYSNHYVINYCDLACGLLGYALKKRSSDFLFNIGSIINKSLLITSQYREHGVRRYGYICTADGYSGSITESDAKRGNGCPACSGRVVIKGKTDVATTHPHIANLFWNIEDTYRYSAFSKTKIDFRCPHCGNKINALIANVTNQGLSCKKCGDNISYSEKFVYNLLQQITMLHANVIEFQNFIPQHTFNWSKNIQHNNEILCGDKKYDFYIPLQMGVCIECHGRQHYEDSRRSGNRIRTLLEEQENDRLKMKLAIQNGILPECYIQLDCKESNIEYIKNSIISSNLPKLLDFTEDQIDWNQCGLFAMSSRMIEACELWNSGIKSTKQIAQEMKINKCTVWRYLRRGEELCIVQDPPKHIKKKTQQND